MSSKPTARGVVRDTRTPYQFAEDMRRRELGLKPINRSGQQTVETTEVSQTAPLTPEVKEEGPEKAENDATSNAAAPVPSEPEPKLPPEVDPLIVAAGLKEVQRLKPTQLRMFKRLAENLTNPQIAEKENTSDASVKATLAAVYKTLGLQNIPKRDGLKRATAAEIAKLYVRG